MCLVEDAEAIGVRPYVCHRSWTIALRLAVRMRVAYSDRIRTRMGARGAARAKGTTRVQWYLI